MLTTKTTLVFKAWQGLAKVASHAPDHVAKDPPKPVKLPLPGPPFPRFEGRAPA